MSCMCVNRKKLNMYCRKLQNHHVFYIWLKYHTLVRLLATEATYSLGYMAKNATYLPGYMANNAKYLSSYLALDAMYLLGNLANATNAHKCMYYGTNYTYTQHRIICDHCIYSALLCNSFTQLRVN